MQTITVAIADVDRERRARYERLLHEEKGIRLLSSKGTNDGERSDHAFSNCRLNQRTDLSAWENEVARIKRLGPNVMLVNLDAGGDEEYAMFLSLRSVVPNTYIVLLADDAVDECSIIRALEIGARGYLNITAVESHLSKALQVVGQGEAWISRKMMGCILDRVLT